MKFTDLIDHGGLTPQQIQDMTVKDLLALRAKYLEEHAGFIDQLFILAKHKATVNPKLKTNSMAHITEILVDEDWNLKIFQFQRESIQVAGQYYPADLTTITVTVLGRVNDEILTGSYLMRVTRVKPYHKNSKYEKVYYKDPEVQKMMAEDDLFLPGPWMDWVKPLMDKAVSQDKAILANVATKERRDLIKSMGLGLE